ncbi:MAG TPA: hypothetical protein PKI20_12645 [Verrucomicrobiota bacterium]|nr:hypothetical protein [Verrucomicrobiota bacterium]
MTRITARLAAITLAFALFAVPSLAADKAATAAACAKNLAPLIDPAKLATLGKRGANPRIQKAVYWLTTAASNSAAPAQVIDTALKDVGMKGEAAVLTKQALLRNLDIASKLGCLDQEGLAAMRRGNAPTVRRGPYTGDKLSVDHIIPRAVCPELDNVIANLELMPLRMNQSKNAKIGPRQLDLAKKLHTAGLLSDEGKQKIETHLQPPPSRRACAENIILQDDLCHSTF